LGQNEREAMMDDRKQQRIEEVKALLAAFADQHLVNAPDLVGYIHRLWEQIGRKRTYVITGGTKEIWASAVVYVVARLNFLFDRSSPNYLPPDTICGFLGTKKGTVSARAAEIEKVCRIRMGHEGLCSEEISDGLTFVQLSNGMVLSKRMAKEMGIMSRPNQASEATSEPALGEDSSAPQG
jgi:hypothetical protein